MLIAAYSPPGRNSDTGFYGPCVSPILYVRSPARERQIGRVRHVRARIAGAIPFSHRVCVVGLLCSPVRSIRSRRQSLWPNHFLLIADRHAYTVAGGCSRSCRFSFRTPAMCGSESDVSALAYVGVVFAGAFPWFEYWLRMVQRSL